MSSLNKLRVTPMFMNVSQVWNALLFNNGTIGIARYRCPLTLGFVRKTCDAVMMSKCKRNRATSVIQRNYCISRAYVPGFIWNKCCSNMHMATNILLSPNYRINIVQSEYKHTKSRGTRKDAQEQVW